MEHQRLSADGVEGRGDVTDGEDVTVDEVSLVIVKILVQILDFGEVELQNGFKVVKSAWATCACAGAVEQNANVQLGVKVAAVVGFDILAVLGFFTVVVFVTVVVDVVATGAEARAGNFAVVVGTPDAVNVKFVSAACAVRLIGEFNRTGEHHGLLF